ncbi:hypothetical protein UCRPC4_g04544 [Phaeomoniella chlamydospora]|uniref:Protein kinase domain-containing protein n=1 Tax=Phaeomoniella chlamydospora TaxID=158046 RepID=A0A0G2EA38_PHACM|nr:hypothetical protein UCRPC4_g04544 [Phaeomoniella chlamydospora]
MEQPLEKPRKTRPRGRSLLEEMAEEKTRSQRAYSESDKAHFDSFTGRQLPQYKNEKQGRDMAYQRGQARHPFLQTTVDDLAHAITGDRPVSLTSESTLSPTWEEVRTPPQTPSDVLQSPRPMSPHTRSYEEYSSPWERQKRPGEAKFFSTETSSMKSARRQSSWRSYRQPSNSAKSPAGSFLRAFSMSRLDDNPEYDRAPSPDDEGQTIGDDYVIGKQIGFGGFSVVKEAFQGTRRKLAVKIVRRNIGSKNESENEAAQAEFEHEVELWRFLKHKHILPLEAVYKTDFATFCFIPLNVGGTLFDLVRSNRQGLPLDMALRYSAQLASAIRYLHEDAHVAHRDVKLENCLLDLSGDVPVIRLCDFGMAEWLSFDTDTYHPLSERPPQKAMGPSESSTNAFGGGSLEYAAPEVLRSNDMPPSASGYPVSAAVDVWAFGVCVYAMVVGDRPFQSSFQPRVTMSILSGDWDRDRLQQKGGDEVLEMMEGCLTMEVEERWTIRDVIESSWLCDEYEATIDEESETAWTF